MTEFLGKSADHSPVAAGILISGEASRMPNGPVVEAFECVTFPSISTEPPGTPTSVISDLQDLRNAQGGFGVYNFEVEEYHTYVAGGIRVHNMSGLLGRVGNAINDGIDGLLGVDSTKTGLLKEGGFIDAVTDVVTAPLHLAGAILNGVSQLAIGAVTAVGGLVKKGLTAFDGWVESQVKDSALADFGGWVGEQLNAFDDWVDSILGIDQSVKKSPTQKHREINDIKTTIDGEPIAKSNHINSNGTHGGIDPGGNSGGDGGSSSGGGNTGRSGGNSGTGLSGEDRPIILDLDGSGVEITQLSQSTVFVDSSGDGLKNQTAWAAAGNGVLFYDADGDGGISEKREYVFTEWDPTATSDIEALKAVFDSNGDGVFDAGDEKWSDFKVLVTLPDGSLVAKTLDELGITSIDLTADATNIELPDGSVITGKTTFTKSDGTTGTVADTTLVSNAQSYRIEESEVTASEGVRTHIQTGYGADGAISFVITSVTSADGTSISNSYDDNGDGVVDRLQTIVTVTNPDGSRSETVTNKAGSDAASAVLVSATKTTTSADGQIVTIERDSTGGGWYDQTEVRTTHADDSMTIVTTDRGSDGNVIRSSTETVSADGLTRTDAIDEDGDGTVELTISHVIVVNADGTRSETIRYLNEDGSLRSAVTESISADGRTKTIARDLDGDGDTDVQEELSITVNADKSTSSTVTVKNGDGSIRSTTTQNQSEDALTKTTAVDQDGDGDVDLTTVEATTIHADDSRETLTTQTNTDGSVRGKVKVTLGSDKVSSETWIDHNQDGVFQATDLSRSVTVDGTTGERTTTSWTRNADGSFSANSVSVTSEDGLVTNTSIDADGDGDTDRSISDVTVENADGTSTRTVTEKAQDGAFRSKQQSVTSADGLTVTTLSDIDGDGAWDGKSVSSRVSNPDGSTLRTVTNHAGDQTTLLSQATVSQSADRRLTITNTDANGDGASDVTLRSEQHADGSMTEHETRLNADGSTRSTQATNVSDDRLTVTVASDVDGDGTVDTRSTTATVLNADGGRTTTSTIKNGNDSLRSQSVTTVSDDGLVTTTSEDRDGDGTPERVVTSTTELLANGSKTTTADVKSSDGSLLSRTQTTVSDDGLTVETRTDRDGNQEADIVSSSVTTLNADGGQTVTTEVTDVTGSSDVLRSRTVTTTSDDGRDVLEIRDVDGDGNVDQRIHRVVGDDGQVTVTETKLDDTGATQSQMVSTTSDNGLETTTRYDADGNGAFERSEHSTTVLKADGSTTRTVEEKTENGTVYRRAVIETSRDGRTTTTREDRDNDGDYDLTVTRSVDLNAAGVETTTLTRTAANGTTLSTDTIVVSADERTVTRSIDADGNGENDQVITTTLADNGTQTSQTKSFNSTGALIATHTNTISDDGLTTTSRTDRNGDGTDELVATATTVLAADGSSSTTTRYTDGGGTLQAKTIATTSDDGFSSTWSADLNGNGTNEFVTTRTITFNADGDIEELVSTSIVNGVDATLVTNLTSGDGLRQQTEFDLTGDGATDRSSVRLIEASGALTQTNRQLDEDGTLVHSVQISESADGRSITQLVDTDGDGIADRDRKAQINPDQSMTTTLRDLKSDGSASTVITGFEAANGSQMSYQFDLDGDGTAEFKRQSDVSFSDDGGTVTTVSETHDNTLSFEEIVTVSADGLTSTANSDRDGDGDWDVSLRETTQLHQDGGETRNVDVTYADGSLRSSMSRETSADGRTVTETRDYDGDGMKDVETTSVSGADGRLTRVETSYDADGTVSNTRTTNVSGDGLVTTIESDDTSFTISRSPVGNGSYRTDYSGDNLDFDSGHYVDVSGIETWGLNRTIAGETTNYAVRLDAASKARILEEAARIYDTILDRDMDRSEVEQLVAHVENGELNLSALAGELIASDEFDARYPNISDASFVSQLYTNALGRGATLDEAADALSALAGGQSRADLAAGLSESSEHIVVGNGHMSSVNFDVFLNAAQVEHSSDRAYVEATLIRAYAVLHGTSDSGSILKLAATQIVNGYATLLGTLDLMLEQQGQWIAPLGNHYQDQNDEEFVQMVLWNTLGQNPSDAELNSWVQKLYQGQLTRGEFVYILANSPEMSRKGIGSEAALSLNGIGSQNVDLAAISEREVRGDERSNSITANNQDENVHLYGLGGNDTLRGGSGNDIISGGDGADSLDGGAGNDVVYFDSDDVQVTGGSGYDTAVVTGDSGVTLQLHSNGFEAAYGSVGNDTLTGDGSHSDLLIFGEAGDDILTGGAGEDVLIGGAGNDRVNGGDSDDRLSGGLGNDTLEGGSGSDLIDGGGGNDELSGGNGGDTLSGGDGDDFLRGGAGDDIVDGNDGDDVIYNGNGDDVIRGGAGNDIIHNDNSDYGDDVIYGDDGDDQIWDGKGDDQYHGGRGDDLFHESAHGDYDVYIGGDGFDTLFLTGDRSDYTVTWQQDIDQIKVASTDGEIQIDTRGVELFQFADGSVIGHISASYENQGFDEYQERPETSDPSDTWPGTQENNLVHATDLDDYRYTGSGDDRIIVFAGNDHVQAGRGDDTVLGGDGDDRLEGNEGADTVFGEEGNDTILGNSGADVLSGGAGADRIHAGGGADRAAGGDADDIIYGEDGDDQLSGDDGNDTVYGGSGSDRIWGGAGQDTLRGDSGSDFLNGGLGNDDVAGGAGSDVVLGNVGNDLLRGEYGSDLLVGGWGEDVLHGGDGDDVLIGDNRSGESGLPELSSGLPAMSATSSDGVAMLYLASDRWLLENVDSTLPIDQKADIVRDHYGRRLEDPERWNGESMTITFDVYRFLASQPGLLPLVPDLWDEDELYSIVAHHYHRRTDIDPDSSWLDMSFSTEIYAANYPDLQNAFGDNSHALAKHYVQTGKTEGRIVDRLLGSNNDTLHGDEGNDRLYGGVGDDSLFGGAGTDALLGGSGDDHLSGDDGADQLVGGTGNDTILGGAGADALYGKTGSDNLDGGDGADLLIGGWASDTLIGGDGDDLLFGDTRPGDLGLPELSSGLPAMSATASDGVAMLYLASDRWLLENIDSTLPIDQKADIVRDHYIRRLEDPERWNGESMTITFDVYRFLASQPGLLPLVPDLWDEEELYSIVAHHYHRRTDIDPDGSWLDMSFSTETYAANYFDLQEVLGDNGHALAKHYVQTGRTEGRIVDRLVATSTMSNDDTLIGGEGIDTLHGGVGDDQLMGGLGDDSLFGGAGADALLGGAGDDYLSGNDGADQLVGGTGNDTILGGAGADTLFGKAGSDNLDGGDGADLLIGGWASDTLIGGDGDDLLFGDTRPGDLGLPELSSGLPAMSATASDGVAMLYLASDRWLLENIDSTLPIDQKADIVRDHYIRRLEDPERWNGESMTITFDVYRFLASQPGLLPLIPNLWDEDEVYSIVAHHYHRRTDIDPDGSWLDMSFSTETYAANYFDLQEALGDNGHALAKHYVQTGRSEGRIADRLVATSTMSNDDTLIGGEGNDTLHGGVGDDVLSGGVGADTFVFNAVDQTGNDTIEDFEDGVDQIDLSDLLLSEVSVSQNGSDAEITWANGAITLNNTVADNIAEDDFIFASSVETEGVGLRVSANGYYVVNDGTQLIKMRDQNGLVDPEQKLASGWQAKHAGADPDGNGYLVYWENSDGQKAIWQLDDGGTLVTSHIADAPMIAGSETAFGLDLTGDGVVGHSYTVRDAIGDVKLLTVDTDNNRYAIETADGDIVHVMNAGTLVSDDSFVGFSAQHATANPDGGGFLLFFDRVNGEDAIWELNSEGSLATSYYVDDAALVDLETVFGADLNDDGSLG
ncbi:DUF4214 domain-containing protein [Ruegeria sp. Ofav3-42]|uniref:DUF4214 domain-containing protein n=1 Tax=Ruegeria sp. Ofav3-42 TaxID=2917759 RepID=UPI001EF5D63E|nr:DUF4214 domain-containing protein [Ruegeria sp. Ofav3-42]MCG7522233.1 DUF4214 domain-containing protein [Ruegeria sp. Ofav3-42]